MLVVVFAGFFFILMFLPMVAGAEPVEIDGIYYELVFKIKEAIVKQSPSGYYSIHHLALP